MGDAEQAQHALNDIARMAETESRALDRAFRVLRDGALVGPAATRLWEDLARRHAQLRQAFERAFASAQAIAARGDGPPPRVAMPHLRPAPVPPPRREVVGGDPDLIELLATEVTRAGRSWEDAGSDLRTILGRIGADPSPGAAVSVAGDWVGAERRDLLHRRADLLKQVELEALESTYADFMPSPAQAAAESALGAAASALASGVSGEDDSVRDASVSDASVSDASAAGASAFGPLGSGVPAGVGFAASAPAGGASAGAQDGHGTAGAAVRALITRLSPVGQTVQRFQSIALSPNQQITRGLATRLDRMGLPSLAGALSSFERDGRSFAVGLTESGTGLLKQVWASTPVGAAFNRGADSAAQVLDPVGHSQESLDRLDGLIWGAQHPIEFGKAAADWQAPR